MEIIVYVEFGYISDLGNFLEYVKYHNMNVLDMEIIKSNDLNESAVGGALTIKLEKRIPHIDVIHVLSRSNGICCVEEI